MASGVEHMKGSQRIAPVVGLVTAVVTLNPFAGLSAAIGCISGIPMSPDLDIHRMTWPKRYMVRKFGPIGWLWSAIWFPYGFFVRHRAEVSHTPILGTAVRVLYLFAPVALLGEYGGWFTAGDVTWLLVGNVYGLGWLFGLAASDAVHYHMDYSWWWKPRVRRLRQLVWRYLER